MNEFPKITLEAARVNAHLQQKEAAKRLGINARTLANYEKGRTVPDMNMGKKIEEVYNFPVRFILFPDG